MTEKKFQGFKPRLDIKGFTSIPNEFFDDVLANIKSLSELKVLLTLFRKTYGWVSHIDPETGQPVFKEEDAISMSQFAKMTGLSSPSCVDGVKRVIEDGYIERVREGSFHGGDSSRNESAVYRIKQIGSDNEQAPPPTTKIKETLDAVEKDRDLDTEMGTDMGFTDRADSPQDILNDFFPPQEEEEEPKKQPKKSYKDIPMDKWNANHLLAYFNNKYVEVMGFGAGPITQKLRGLSKKLQEGYSNEILVRAIDYYLENYKEISYLPEGYPNFNIFFGFRQSLIPEALNPSARKNTSNQTKTNKATREYKGDTSGEDQGGYEW